MRAEFTAKQQEPNNFYLELERPAALSFEMARFARKNVLAIKGFHPRCVFLLLVVLLYAFTTFYHTSLTLMQGTIVKKDDLKSVLLITQAVRYFALLVMFIVLIIYFVDPDEERLQVSDGENRRANIYDTTIL